MTSHYTVKTSWEAKEMKREDYNVNKLKYVAGTLLKEKSESRLQKTSKISFITKQRFEFSGPFI